MKLLLDQNVSRRLLPELDIHFPKSTQVGLLGMGESIDIDIINYAKANGFTVVTHDSDFQDHVSLNGGPPAIVWLRCGNQPNKEILDRILKASDLFTRANHKVLNANQSIDKQILGHPQFHIEL